MTSVTSQVMGVHEVFEPSAKVKRKHCWNTETKMQTAIVNMLKAVFILFKSEKDRPDNFVQLARGNGGET